MSRRRRCQFPEYAPRFLCALREQPVHQRACLERIPVRRRHQLLSDYPVPSDDERLRITTNVVQIGDLTLGIVENLESQPELLRERADARISARIVDADRN